MKKYPEIFQLQFSHDNFFPDTLKSFVSTLIPFCDEIRKTVCIICKHLDSKKKKKLEKNFDEQKGNDYPFPCTFSQVLIIHPTLVGCDIKSNWNCKWIFERRSCNTRWKCIRDDRVHMHEYIYSEQFHMDKR